MKVKYVEFNFPGFLFSESSIRPRKTDNPKNIEIPDGAFGFRFCERTEAILDGEKVLGEMKYESKTYYAPGSDVFSLAQVEAGAIKGDCKILISNMKSNGYARVVKTNRGNVQPFDENCVLL